MIEVEELQKELKNIEQMDNKTLMDEFEDIIGKGAGPGFLKVIWMKREIMRRMDKRIKREDDDKRNIL